MRWIGLLLLGLLTAAGAQAATYCVHPTAGNDSNTGTASGANCTGTVAPWKTFAKVNSTTVAGDTILLARGSTYTQTGLTDRWNAKDNQTIGAYGSQTGFGFSNRPIIDGGVMTDNAERNFVGQIQIVAGVHGVTIQDLDIREGNWLGIFAQNGNDITINRVVMHDKTGETGAFMWINNTTNLSVRNSEFHHIIESPGSLVAQGTFLYNVSTCVFENNYFHDSDRLLLGFGMATTVGSVTGCTIQGNSLINIAGDPSIYGGGGFQDSTITHNAMWGKSGVGTTITNRAYMSWGIEDSAQAVRNNVLSYNIAAYNTHTAHTAFIQNKMPAGPGRGTVDAQPQDEP